MKMIGLMMSQNLVVVKTFYYTECDKEKIQSFATYVKENFLSGTYLIKVWDSGNIIGFYKVA